jgi:hypothetical protein
LSEVVAPEDLMDLEVGPAAHGDPGHLF